MSIARFSYLRARALAHPVKPEQPFRAWVGTNVSHVSWDFDTMEQAEAFISAQIKSCNGRVAVGAAPVKPRTLDPMESFIQHAEGIITLADMGWQKPLLFFRDQYEWAVL